MIMSSKNILLVINNPHVCMISLSEIHIKFSATNVEDLSQSDQVDVASTYTTKSDPTCPCQLKSMIG